VADSKLVVMLKLDGTELGKGITKAQADIAKIGAAFTGVGLAAGAAVKFAADFQDSTIKAARSAGVASQAFSSLSYAASLSGVSSEQLGKSLVKLQAPSESAARTFKDLGIQAKDARGKMKDQSTLLEELAGKFEQIQDPAIKSQAAVRIFGEEGTKMVSMLEGGKKALQEARAEAEAFGQTVSEKAGKAAEQFNDNITKVGMGLSGIRNVVSESAIEFVNQSKAMEKVQDVLKGVISYWRGLSTETQQSIIKVVAITAGLGALLLALSAVAAALPALAAGFALLTAPISLIALGIAGMIKFGADFNRFWEESKAKAMAFAAALGPMGIAIAQTAKLFKWLYDNLIKTSEAMTNIGDSMDYASKRAGELLKMIEKKRPAMIKLSAAAKTVATEYYAIAGAVETGIAAVAKGAKDAQVATANMVREIAEVAGQVVRPFSGLTDAIAKGIEYDAAVASRDLDAMSQKAEEAYNAQREALESQEDAKLKALDKSYQDQIDALRNAEEAKNTIAQFAANERLLIADDEYNQAKAMAEAKFAADLERDQMEYEAKMAVLDSRAIDREQRQLTETIMDEDARLLREARQREHEERLAALAKEHSGKIKGIDDDLKLNQKVNTEKNKLEIEALTLAKNEALTAAEAEKNAKLKGLDDARAAEEKSLEKQRLETQYKAQLDAFNATKATKIAETVASGIASAAQAFAALAPIPFVGIGLGTAAAAVISGAMAMRVAQINSQAPIKPAGLLEDGGVIGGNRSHAMGGIPAEVESGELYIDKGRTAKLLGAIDNSLSGIGGGVSITFAAGAIQGDIRDEKTIEKISQKIGQQIQRRMVFQ